MAFVPARPSPAQLGNASEKGREGRIGRSWQTASGRNCKQTADNPQGVFRESQYPEIPKELLGNDASPSPARFFYYFVSVISSTVGLGISARSCFAPRGIKTRSLVYISHGFNPWTHGFIPLAYRSLESQTLCVLREGKQELEAEGLRMQ